MCAIGRRRQAVWLWSLDDARLRLVREGRVMTSLQPRDRGLNGGRASRRRVSVLVRAVAAGAVALGAVLGVAPCAAAEEGQPQHCRGGGGPHQQPIPGWISGSRRSAASCLEAAFRNRFHGKGFRAREHAAAGVFNKPRQGTLEQSVVDREQPVPVCEASHSPGQETRYHLQPHLAL